MYILYQKRQLIGGGENKDEKLPQNCRDELPTMHISDPDLAPSPPIAHRRYNRTSSSRAPPVLIIPFLIVALGVAF